MLEKKVSLDHGSGGLETSRLLRRLFKQYIRMQSSIETSFQVIDNFDIPKDSAFIRLGDKYAVFTTDMFTVKPLFFPGGNLGKLAVTGTINDLLVSGAEPIGILDSLLIEEGLEIDVVEKITDSMIVEAAKNNVFILGGDLKVMPKGELDKMVINTAGIGFTDSPITDKNIMVGDKIVVSGTIGDHGAVISALQYGLKITSKLESDVASLRDVMMGIKNRFSFKILGAARDPTRGGLSMVLNDWAELNKKRIVIEEKKIPFKPEVKGISSILGLNPLHLASEGRVVLSVRDEVAEDVVEFLRSLGMEDASIIGHVEEGEPVVVMVTNIGGRIIVEPPTGTILPRIC